MLAEVVCWRAEGVLEMKKRRIVYRYRSAVTGRMVTKSYAKRYPHLTIREKVRKQGFYTRRARDGSVHFSKRLVKWMRKSVAPFTKYRQFTDATAAN